MATVPDFRLDALHAPGPDTVIEHLYDLCAPKQGNSGDRTMDLTRLGVLPHGRQLETASLDDLCKVFGALVDAGSADGKPGMMAVGLPARGNADSAAVGDARMKAALAQALLQYLWRCDDRGGLRFSATAVLLPAVPTSAPNPLAASGATSSAPSAAASSNSVPSSPSSAPASSAASTATAATASPSSPATTAGATNAGKRLLSEISEVAADLAEESVAGDSQRPPKKQSLVYTTISSKFTALWTGLLTSVSGLTTFDHSVQHQRVLEIKLKVQELARLAAMDPALSDERAFVDTLAVGIDAAMQFSRPDAAAVWVHDKLMSQTEEGRKTDRLQVQKELSAITKFLGGPKHSPAPAGPWGPPPVQPVALAPHFGGYSPYGMQPYGGQPGHYTPGRGSGGRHRPSGGRGGRGGGRRALCNTCRRAGKTGADIEHSYRVCPFVQCHKCRGMGHVMQNCPN